MSRGFVKEDDQEEIPILVPRAHLPFGVDNYVTSKGLYDLNEEQELLIKERALLMEEGEQDNRVQANHITAKLNLLRERINSAKLVDMSTLSRDKVHFGALVSLFKEEEDCTCQYQIVGVDEADIISNKISFLSPIAKMLLGKRVGDIIVLKTPKGERNMKIESIQFPELD